jgi:hypothetical protein
MSPSSFAPRKRGRPRVEDRGKPKEPWPWDVLGISKRTFYAIKADPERRIALEEMIKEKIK